MDKATLICQGQNNAGVSLKTFTQVTAIKSQSHKYKNPPGLTWASTNHLSKNTCPHPTVCPGNRKPHPKLLNGFSGLQIYSWGDTRTRSLVLSLGSKQLRKQKAKVSPLKTKLEDVADICGWVALLVVTPYSNRLTQFWVLLGQAEWNLYSPLKGKGMSSVEHS